MQCAVKQPICSYFKHMDFLCLMSLLPDHPTLGIQYVGLNHLVPFPTQHQLLLWVISALFDLHLYLETLLNFSVVILFFLTSICSMLPFLFFFFSLCLPLSLCLVQMGFLFKRLLCHVDQFTVLFIE